MLSFFRNICSLRYLLVLSVLLIASCVNTKHSNLDVSNCSQPPPPTRFPAAKKKLSKIKTVNIKNGLVIYKSQNIKGHKNSPVIIDSLFVPTLNKINTIAKNNNLTVVVTHSFRKANKKLTGAIVKPAKYSNHLTGHAIDMNIVYKNKWYTSRRLRKSNLRNLPYSIQNFVNGLRKEPNIRWGGDFRSEDPIHIDDNFNSDLTKWKTRYSLCQKQAHSRLL